jgi:hypothetical protein
MLNFLQRLESSLFPHANRPQVFRSVSTPSMVVVDGIQILSRNALILSPYCNLLPVHFSSYGVKFECERLLPLTQLCLLAQSLLCRVESYSWWLGPVGGLLEANPSPDFVCRTRTTGTCSTGLPVIDRTMGQEAALG